MEIASIRAKMWAKARADSPVMASIVPDVNFAIFSLFFEATRSLRHPRLTQFPLSFLRIVKHRFVPSCVSKSRTVENCLTLPNARDRFSAYSQRHNLLVAFAVYHVSI